MVNSRSSVIFRRGALATERRLLDELARLAPKTPEDLGAPVRVVVPSRSLRRHLLRVLVEERGAVAGVKVQTLFDFGREVVVASGQSPPSCDAAFEIVVRRLAAADPRLSADLGSLSDGYDSVLGAVRDLLDAGFLPGNEDGLSERLDEVRSEVAAERVERSHALVRLASAALEKAEEDGAERSNHVLQMAEDALKIRGPDLIPTRHLLIHGFADVTGIAADLLLAMVTVLGGEVLLDRPPDPARPDRDDLGAAYLSRLEEKLAHLDREIDERAEPSATVELVEAPDAEAETRWVAERIRALLDGGVTAEEVGIVSRDMESRVRSLRRHLGRLGVPFSGEGLTIVGARPRRRLDRLVEVLGRGGGAEIDLWLEAREGDSRSTELLLGLRVVGVLRLADLASLRDHVVPADGVRLPLALGREEDGEIAEGPVRRLGSEVLQRAREQAARLVTALQERPGFGSAGLHARGTEAVLEALDWTEDSVEYRAVDRAFAEIAAQLPPVFDLTADEWLKLLADRLSHAGQVPLGGGGAGVRLLTVMEARALTFSHLFVIGLQRGVFPRVGPEDPMLPEAVRARLAADVLPEMPVKGRGADEERYLFAQLMSSAPSVCVSWHVFGEKGTVTASPFVERLRLREDVPSPTPAPSLWPEEEPANRPRTAYELAVLGGVSADALAPMIDAALAEGRSDAGVSTTTTSAHVVGAARADLVKAVEAPEGDDAPSAWFGFCGATRDPEEAPLWVTRAEQTGTCPWRAFVEERLGVAPMPDPLLGMPRIDGLLVGNVVHGVLEAVVADVVGRHGDLERALAKNPAKVKWPDQPKLEVLLSAQARRVASRAGLAPLGLEPLLVERARRVLDRAKDLEWGRGFLEGVHGAEVEGEARVPRLTRPLVFRADRVDTDGGTVVLVDYKVSKPAVTAKTEPARGKNIRRKVSRGRLLQAAAYSQAVGDQTGRGRYVYLKPGDWADEVCELVIEGDDEDLIDGFATAVQTIDRARASGIAFPRVEEADGSSAAHCTYCGVSEACRRDDSNFRRNLVHWMNDADVGTAHPEDAVARALWWLGFDRSENGE